MAAISGKRYTYVVYRLPTGSRCHFVLLDNDESCPTADLSNMGRPNGPTYSTGELLNTPQKLVENFFFKSYLYISC